MPQKHLVFITIWLLLLELLPQTLSAEKRPPRIRSPEIASAVRSTETDTTRQSVTQIGAAREIYSALTILEARRYLPKIPDESNAPCVVGPADREIADTTSFDLYLGGVFNGIAVVTFGERWVEIENIEDLIDQLQGVKRSSELSALFTGAICKQRTVAGLGKLDVDLSTFRLLITLEPQHLEAKAVELDERIPSPESKLSLLQEVGLAGSQVLGEGGDGAISHRTLASVGAYRGELEGTHLTDGGYELTTATLGAVIGGFELSAGSLETEGQSFANSLRYFGARLTSAPELYLDTESLIASPLRIFVPRRSRVEFFRGERLIGVQVLEYGLQEVDTRSFPHGSYEVEVIIHDDDGGERSERHFFTKSGLLGIGGPPQLTVGGGYLRDQFSLEDQLLYEARVDWRALGWLQLSGATAGLDDLNLSTIGFLGMYREALVGAEYARSSEGDAAVSGRFELELWGINLSAYGSRTLSGFESGSTADLCRISRELCPQEQPPTLFPQPTPTPPGGELLTSSRLNYGISVGTRQGPLDLRYTASSNESGTAERRYAHGPRLSYELLRDEKNLLQLRGVALESDQGKSWEAELVYERRLGKWRLDSSVLSRNRRETDSLALSETVNYDDKNPAGKGSRLRMRSEGRREERRDTASTNVLEQNLEYERINGLYRIAAQLRDLRGGSERSTALSTVSSTSFLLSQDGAVSLAPLLGQTAFVSIDLQSDSTVTPMEIVVNGQVMDRVPAGGRTVIPLSPYRVYRVSVRPAEDADLVHYDTGAEQFVLFPGNVLSRRFSVEKVFVALGRLVEQDGTPLSWKRIQGVKGFAVTEADGTFQIETSGRQPMYVESKGWRCEFSLDAPPSGEFILDAGDVICQASGKAPSAPRRVFLGEVPAVRQKPDQSGVRRVYIELAAGAPTPAEAEPR